ncbi:MAG: DUF1513 domain-containing protein [Pseudomonadota bacterium]
MPSRRALIAGLAASFAPSLGWAAVGNPVAVSAAKTSGGAFILVGLSAAGAITFQIPLPARGHAAAAHPHLAEVVAIARRPGTFAKVIDCTTGLVRQTLEAPEGRHFYGHGAFSADGTLLFTTENHVSSGAGRVGVWDRSLGYQRIEELPSHGIGPHEILRRPDGSLAIANGGIRTHPGSGRDKLNLDTMRANLTVLSARGSLIDHVEVPPDRHHNSLRHIAVQADGRIACGFQWQGDPYAVPPLIAIYDGEGLQHDVSMEDTLLRSLDGYIGSVGAHGPSGFMASSPRGGRFCIIDLDGNISATHRASDVCGVTPASSTRSLITDGTGHVYDCTEQTFGRLARYDLAFDNHLVRIAPAP